jgi:K+-transporting ATPase ATPase A chain
MAGLMVGRTPEYLGKKIEAREVKMTMLAVLCLPLVMLGFTAIAVVRNRTVGAVGQPAARLYRGLCLQFGGGQ